MIPCKKKEKITKQWLSALQCESNGLPEDQYYKQSINCDIYALQLVLPFTLQMYNA